MSYTAYSDINSLDEASFIGGSDFYLDFSVVDSNGSPVSLNGASITWVMSNYGYSDALLTKTLADDISITGDVTNGVFEVHILPADTLSLSGKFSHQATVVDSAGEEFTPNQGIITIIKKITS